MSPTAGGRLRLALVIENDYRPADTFLSAVGVLCSCLASFVPSVTVVLSLVEIPGWCITNGRCYWSCYPDFSRNYHMSKWVSMLFEGPLLLALTAMALVDVVSETMPLAGRIVSVGRGIQAYVMSEVACNALQMASSVHESLVGLPYCTAVAFCWVLAPTLPHRDRRTIALLAVVLTASLESDGRVDESGGDPKTSGWHSLQDRDIESSPLSVSSEVHPVFACLQIAGAADSTARFKFSAVCFCCHCTDLATHPHPRPSLPCFHHKIKQRSQHTCGNEYWSGSRKRQYQSMWFKHATIAAYLTFYLLSIVVDFRAHALCSFCRILLYLSVHRRTVLVVTQLRCAYWEGKGVGG